MIGPTITITISCSNCQFINYDYFTDGSWSCKQRCLSPDCPVPEPISSKEHVTPDYCPLLHKNMRHIFEEYLPEEIKPDGEVYNE